jgi:hypothetical protein
MIPIYRAVPVGAPRRFRRSLSANHPINPGCDLFRPMEPSGGSIFAYSADEPRGEWGSSSSHWARPLPRLGQEVYLLRLPGTPIGEAMARPTGDVWARWGSPRRLGAIIGEN